MRIIRDWRPKTVIHAIKRDRVGRRPSQSWYVKRADVSTNIVYLQMNYRSQSPMKPETRSTVE